MTDGDSAEVTDGDSAEEAAWRELIGRFDVPSYSGDAPAPWPAIEDLGHLGPAGPQPAGPQPGLSLPGATDADPLEEEHYVPPPPPPIRLEPITKGAWAGLFGGPGYLIVATVAGWSVPGWAAFCAVAAFIAGFTILVLRIGDDQPRDPGSGDGAVV